MLEAVRIVFAGFLFLVGGLITLANGRIVWLGIRNRGEGPFHSFVPMIGGIAGAAGLSLAPLGSISDRLPDLWVPFVRDAGSGMNFGFFVAAIVDAIFRRDGE